VPLISRSLLTRSRHWELQCNLRSLQAALGDSGMERLMTTLIIEGLYRDVLKNRSFVTVTWKDEPEKRLGLPVPFDCQLDALKTETEKAVRALAKELDSATVQDP
jgi:hypothetical protein